MTTTITGTITSFLIISSLSMGSVAFSALSHPAPLTTPHQHFEGSVMTPRLFNGEYREGYKEGYREGYKGYIIPEDMFIRFYGPSHAFYLTPYLFTIHNSLFWFTYGGLYFSLAEPVPTIWNHTDCYIDMTDSAYVLNSRAFPGIHIALTAYTSAPIN